MLAAKRLIYGYIVLAGLSTLLYYIVGYKVVLEFLGILILIFIGAYGVYYITKSAFHSEPRGFIEFFIMGIYKLSMILSVFLVLFGGFCYYQNNISPANFPLYTLSNGKKIVQFQTMSHIARQEFYDSVRINIGRAKSDGFILFYEGVRPGSEKNMQSFEQILGLQFGSDFYKKYSKLYGLVPQDNTLFMGIRNKKDFNIDLDIDTIVNLYNEKTLPQEQKQQREEEIKLGRGQNTIYDLGVGETGEVDGQIPEVLTSGDENTTKVARYVYTALLNWIIKQESLQNFILENAQKKDIFSIIVGERNQNLAGEIEKTRFQKIHIIYGMLHFRGVLEILQKNDPNWSVQAQEDFYPITKKNIPSF